MVCYFTITRIVSNVKKVISSLLKSKSILYLGQMSFCTKVDHLRSFHIQAGILISWFCFKGKYSLLQWILLHNVLILLSVQQHKIYEFMMLKSILKEIWSTQFQSILNVLTHFRWLTRECSANNLFQVTHLFFMSEDVLWQNCAFEFWQKFQQ